MELKHQCSNCEFNFDGVCAGSTSTYGQRIVDESKCCEDWRAGLEYYTYECAVAPRFLREKYHDGSLAYHDFSAQFADFRAGNDVPINIFDAIKHIYRLSMVDIAVLADVTYGVVFQAKTKYIPRKRMQQFCNALCISENTLMKDSTAVFGELHKGSEILMQQENLTELLSAIPEWKQKIVSFISNDCLHCPIHLAKTFARIDKMYWEHGMNLDEYTESEKALITYYTKRNRNVMRIEYFLDIAGMPHIHAMMRDNVS